MLKGTTKPFVNCSLPTLANSLQVEIYTEDNAIENGFAEKPGLTLFTSCKLGAISGISKIYIHVHVY